jgi:hypothetical protein
MNGRACDVADEQDVVRAERQSAGRLQGARGRGQSRDASKDLRHVDCIVSHTVLEHIPEQILRKFFRDSKSSLRPGGVHSHGIDHTDHRANVDPRLSRIDFLRYSDLTWGLISITPQICTNRLRNSDYISMLRETGHQIVWERKLVIHQAAHEAKDMKLSGRFRDKHIDDLATGWSHLVATPSS